MNKRRFTDISNSEHEDTSDITLGELERTQFRTKLPYLTRDAFYVHVYAMLLRSHRCPVQTAVHIIDYMFGGIFAVRSHRNAKLIDEGIEMPSSIYIEMAAEPDEDVRNARCPQAPFNGVMCFDCNNDRGPVHVIFGGEGLIVSLPETVAVSDVFPYPTALLSSLYLFLDFIVAMKTTSVMQSLSSLELIQIGNFQYSEHDQDMKYEKYIDETLRAGLRRVYTH